MSTPSLTRSLSRAALAVTALVVLATSLPMHAVAASDKDHHLTPKAQHKLSLFHEWQKMNPDWAKAHPKEKAYLEAHPYEADHYRRRYNAQDTARDRYVAWASHHAAWVKAHPEDDKRYRREGSAAARFLISQKDDRETRQDMNAWLDNHPNWAASNRSEAHNLLLHPGLARTFLQDHELSDTHNPDPRNAGLSRRERMSQVKDNSY